MTAAGFYHCSVKSVGRANGRSVVAAAAYRAGERLRDEIAGVTADYQLRHGVVATFIVAPDHAPAWARDREALWNAAERAEPRANGRLATEIEIALPHELSDAQRREMLTGFVRGIVQRHGVAADVAIHAPGEGRDHRNIHAHVLLTHRALDAEGFGGIANERTAMKKAKGKEKETKIAGLAATPADIRAIRQEFERAVNRAYERAGLDIRVDARSHRDRGIEAEPSKHLGPTAAEMERRGKPSERGDANREISARNAERRELAGLESEAKAIDAEIIEAERARETRAGQGRADDIRAEFTAASARATEPAAVNFDRDAAEAAWLDQVAAAGIASDEAARAAQEAGREGAARQAGEEGIAAYPAASENAPAATTTRPIVAPPAFAGADSANRKTPEPAEIAATAADPGIRSPERVAGGIMGGLAKAAEAALGVLSGLFATPVRPTPEQGKRNAQSAEEAARLAEFRAYVAKQESELSATNERSQEQQQERDRDREEESRARKARERDPDSGRER